MDMAPAHNKHKRSAFLGDWPCTVGYGRSPFRQLTVKRTYQEDSSQPLTISLTPHIPLETRLHQTATDQCKTP
jgi:hypothetical protein